MRRSALLLAVALPGLALLAPVPVLAQAADPALEPGRALAAGRLAIM